MFNFPHCALYSKQVRSHCKSEESIIFVRVSPVTTHQLMEKAVNGRRTDKMLVIELVETATAAIIKGRAKACLAAQTFLASILFVTVNFVSKTF